MAISHWTYSALGSRTRQEDAALVIDLPNAWTLAAVADGMGGHPRGDEAAPMALNTLQTLVQSFTPPAVPDQAGWFSVLQHQAVAMHAALRHAFPYDDPSPGTTALWVFAHPTLGAWVGHIGDSRLTLIPAHQAALPLTLDMTPAGARVAAGQAPWDHQNTAPDAHILTSCLGAGFTKLQRFSVPWRPGDSLVLATDGLNALPLTAWPTLLQQDDPAHTAVTQVSQSLGLTDNTTVVVLHNH